MDSLHPSLSQALPLRDYDAEQALQAPFRAAALGIATFYKKAAENGRKAYTLGYSSALQDVLAHLQTALDQSDPDHPQQSMVLTIGRVIDYIQRRQEALRAESQEPHDEEAPHPSPAPQHRQSQSTTPPASHPTPSPTEPASQVADSHPHSRESPNLNLAVEPCPSTAQPVRRRTSPRRMTLAGFPTATGASGSTDPDSTSPPAPSPALTASILPQPLNVTFSSFAASPLPQHQQPNVISTSHISGRRHRGAPSEGTRKGKLRERGTGADRSGSGAGTLDPTGLGPRGYSHYGSTNSSSSSSEVKTLSSIGAKRRFPVESVLAIHDSNPSSAPSSPASMRITRRSNPTKSLAPPPLEQPQSTASSTTLDGPTLQIHPPDDAVMIFQDPDPDHDRAERPSKRFFFL